MRILITLMILLIDAKIDIDISREETFKVKLGAGYFYSCMKRMHQTYKRLLLELEMLLILLKI